MSDPRNRFAKVPLLDSELAAALELLSISARQANGGSFHFINAYSVVLAQQDPQLLNLYESSIANFCY
jgi:UDP-N-acetyl-D-mannosaminuronic acid transferase (WecB/TagA/CpsF family)